jgi:O-antigen/teichoic acid export membrane protein
MSIHVIPTYALNSARHTKLVMYLYCANIFVNLGLNIFLIPKYGYIATSYISVLCNVIVAAGALYFVKIKIGSFVFFGNIIRICGALAGQLLFLNIFGKTMPFIPLDALSLLVFYGSIFAMGYFNKEDFSIARNILKKS